MAERLEPIFSQVPVEGIAFHIGRSGLAMGDEARAALLSDGRVGIFAQVRRMFLGIFPRRRLTYVGHLGPIAEQVLAPALQKGVSLRVHIVVITPEHLATSGPPEIHVSIWGDASRIGPLPSLDELYEAGPAEEDAHVAKTPSGDASEEPAALPPDPEGSDAAPDEPPPLQISSGRRGMR